MPFHMLGFFGAAAGGATGAGAGAGAAWRGAGCGAGWAGMRLTFCDWRPNERPPPAGRAIASVSSDMAETAITAPTRIFFKFIVIPVITF